MVPFDHPPAIFVLSPKVTNIITVYIVHLQPLVYAFIQKIMEKWPAFFIMEKWWVVYMYNYDILQHAFLLNMLMLVDLTQSLQSVSSYIWCLKLFPPYIFL